MISFQILQMDPDAAKWLGFAKQQCKRIMDNGTKDFYREWTMGDGAKVKVKSYGGTAKLWLVAIAHGPVRFTLSSTGILTATLASGASKSVDLSVSGYSQFGQLLVYYASAQLTGKVAVTATRVDFYSQQPVNIVLTGLETYFGFWFSNPSACPFNEIVLDQATFPLIAAGQARVATDIGAMRLFANYSFNLPELVVFGPHPTDGTIRYYYASDTYPVAYVTDSTTASAWNNGGIYNRFNDIYSNIGPWRVDMSQRMQRIGTRNPVTGATIVDIAKTAYTPMYGWILCNSFGDVGGLIDITGTDWIILQTNTQYAYFIRTVTGNAGISEVKVYVVDGSACDTGGGMPHITPLASLTGIGEYRDAYITSDTTPYIFASFSSLGDFIIASDGSYTTPTKPMYPNAPYPKAKTPQLSAVKGTI